MGMFDWCYIHKSLVQHLLTDELNEAFQMEKSDNPLDEKYYICQTKDLDNCLVTYYFEPDNSIFELKTSWDDECRVNTKELSNITSYIDCYDYVITPSEEGMVTFHIHAIEGKVQTISLKEVKLTQSSIIQQNKIISKEKRDRVHSDWRWKAGHLIGSICIEFNKIIYPIPRAIDKLRKHLMDSAWKKEFPQD